MGKGSRREEAVRRQVRRALPDLKSLHLPDMRDLHLPDMKDLHLPELHAPEIDWGRGRMGSRAASLWPALFAAAGAGAAVWWWNSWARGRAEADAAAHAEGAGRPEVEPPPEATAVDAETAAPPEAIVGRAPPSKPRPPRKPKAGVASPERATLDESLAVQGAATPPAQRPER